jgi:hypothetical protein
LSGHFRTFLQLDSGLNNGRDGGPHPGIDEDTLDINQGFADITTPKSSDHSFTVRAGRQLISLGSTRLIATGTGLNVEQPFDGFRLIFRAGQWSADGLAVRPTAVKTGIFDNEPNPDEELWGLYLIDYAFSQHLSGSLACEHFFTGEFLKQGPPGHGLNFISPQLTYNF